MSNIPITSVSSPPLPSKVINTNIEEWKAPSNWDVKDNFVSSSETKVTTRDRSQSLNDLNLVTLINSNELTLNEIPDLKFVNEPANLESSNSKEKKDKKNITKSRSKSLSFISEKLSDWLKFNKSQDKSKK